ncbi:MAG: hypothetical protein LBL32_00685 [Holosporales bacterium]|nr:hypothetical protein [Holosporales bacterium]
MENRWKGMLILGVALFIRTHESLGAAGETSEVPYAAPPHQSILARNTPYSGPASKDGYRQLVITGRMPTERANSIVEAPAQINEIIRQRWHDTFTVTSNYYLTWKCTKIIVIYERLPTNPSFVYIYDKYTAEEIGRRLCLQSDSGNNFSVRQIEQIIFPYIGAIDQPQTTRHSLVHLQRVGSQIRLGEMRYIVDQLAIVGAGLI